MQTDTDRLIHYRLTKTDRAICDEIKRALGFASDPDLIRFALYNAAVQADLRIGPFAFTNRRRIPRRRERGSL